VPRCALLPSVAGAYNKGYTVQPSARASPKFFFHFIPEKLRISLTHLYKKTDNEMKKRTFDIVVIFMIAIFLITLNQFDVLEKSAKFMFIQILAFYFLGQYSEQKLKK